MRPAASAATIEALEFGFTIVINQQDERSSEMHVMERYDLRERERKQKRKFNQPRFKTIEPRYMDQPSAAR
jgi:hypothetical protein